MYIAIVIEKFIIIPILKNKVYDEICNFDPSRGMLCILL